MLHARLAQASAEIQMYQDAVDEAQEALRLDGITPHPDKKLPDTTRDELKAILPEWTQKAAQFKVGRGSRQWAVGSGQWAVGSWAVECS